MRIVWSLQAQEDLEAIRAYIGRDSIRYADSTIERIIASTDRLASFPRSGRQVPEFARDDLREVIVAPYRLVYELGSAAISIVTVCHGARLLRLPPDAG
jgi:toxin ParE1/3/4